MQKSPHFYAPLLLNPLITTFALGQSLFVIFVVFEFFGDESLLGKISLVPSVSSLMAAGIAVALIWGKVMLFG